MRVARTTVQQIYNISRTKITNAIVDGTAILIEGRDYQLYDGKEEYYGCEGAGVK